MSFNGPTNYKSSAGGGSASSDYLKDAFKDISVPATSNTGFSSTVSKNPLNGAFTNDDAPKFDYKTLWVKDLVLLDDHSKWQDDRPTYRVIFHEDFPGVDAYVWGDVRLRNSQTGISVDLREGGDGFGITTTGRRCHWFVNPSGAATQSAYVKVDGAINSQSISYGSFSGIYSGTNFYYAGANATTNDTRDIHDYQLVASNTGTLNISGVGVYFEAATAGLVDFYPGSTYVNMTKVTTSSGSGVSLPSLSGFIGGAHVLYKTAAQAYAVATQERRGLTTIAQGTDATNLVTVTTGTGASFPVGTGVVVQSHGGSYYVGAVVNVSTDTLTVSPSLVQGLSGLMWRAWQAGNSLTIGSTAYRQVGSIDFGSAFTPGNQFSFLNTQNMHMYQDPQNLFRVYGQSLINTSNDGYKGIRLSVLNSFLQVEGNFCAAEAEWIAGQGATSVIHATYMINGAPGAFSQQFGFTSSIKKVLFTDGMAGFNQFRMTAGGSMLNAVLRKINFYDVAAPVGPTLGRLAEIKTYGTQVNRNFIGTTVAAFGTHQRVYADQMYLTGNAVIGATHSLTGGVYMNGSSGAAATIRYYGKDFCVVGSQSASTIIQLNGSTVGATFGLVHSVATLGFHTVTVSNSASTMILSAFDFFRPRGEIRNVQNFLPRPELDDAPGVYQQSDTPLNPKPGSIWFADPKAGSAWIYLANKWNQIQLIASADDPQVNTTTVYGGNQ